MQHEKIFIQNKKDNLKKNHISSISGLYSNERERERVQKEQRDRLEMYHIYNEQKAIKQKTSQCETKEYAIWPCQ